MRNHLVTTWNMRWTGDRLIDFALALYRVAWLTFITTVIIVAVQCIMYQ